MVFRRAGFFFLYFFFFFLSHTHSGGDGVGGGNGRSKKPVHTEAPPRCLSWVLYIWRERASPQQLFARAENTRSWRGGGEGRRAEWSRRTSAGSRPTDHTGSIPEYKPANLAYRSSTRFLFLPTPRSLYSMSPRGARQVHTRSRSFGRNRRSPWWCIKAQ